MAVSHSFTGEHVKDAGDEKADTSHKKNNIEHVITSARVSRVAWTLDCIAAVDGSMQH
jgi:hypothetical protein